MARMFRTHAVGDGQLVRRGVGGRVKPGHDGRRTDVRLVALASGTGVAPGSVSEAPAPDRRLSARSAAINAAMVATPTERTLSIRRLLDAAAMLLQLRLSRK
jgi:hypothetical protein